MLLAGKRILVTGVLNDRSIAFSVARLAQEQGADVLLSSFGRALPVTRRAARKLATPVSVISLDVTSDDDLASLPDRLDGPVHGILHAVAYAPESCLGEGFLEAPWPDVATALRVSAYSLTALVRAAGPYLCDGAAVVGLDFDNSAHAWPTYSWMGVAKAALESSARYIAREVGPRGIRVNLVAAGPLRTIAARSVPGFARFEDVWSERAPLGWDVRDNEPVARACVALLSDWFPATTGEIIHVDGGFHGVGA